jgi:hypothetical protein
VGSCIRGLRFQVREVRQPANIRSSRQQSQKEHAIFLLNMGMTQGKDICEKNHTNVFPMSHKGSFLGLRLLFISAGF